MSIEIQTELNCGVFALFFCHTLPEIGRARPAVDEIVGAHGGDHVVVHAEEGIPVSEVRLALATVRVPSIAEAP